MATETIRRKVWGRVNRALLILWMMIRHDRPQVSHQKNVAYALRKSIDMSKLYLRPVIVPPLEACFVAPNQLSQCLVYLVRLTYEIFELWVSTKLWRMTHTTSSSGLAL